MKYLHLLVRRLSLALSVLVLVALAGCSDEELLTVDPPPEPDPESDVDPMFDRYVAIGNSITAGYQSNGINATLQEQAFPVLLAGQMGLELDEEFFIPRLNAPGCPPPLTQIFPTQERLGPAGVDCALREQPLPPMLNNVAVPGAEVIDVLTNLADASNANTLTTLFLGGIDPGEFADDQDPTITQLEAALAADPTFASVWIGNNDVLAAALRGDTEAITDVSTFTQTYSQVLNGLGAAPNLSGGILFAVADVTLAPVLSPGAAYYQAVPMAQQAQAAPPNLSVADSCVPSDNGGVGDQMLVPFQHGATLLQVASSLFEQAGQNAPTITLDCAADRTVEETVGSAFGGVANIPEEITEAIAGTADYSILTGQEIVAVKTAVAGYNAFIEQQAQERDWAYFDVNPIFTAEQYHPQANPTGRIPLFPELVDDPNNNFTTDEPFGPLFSLDGVHPSSEAHRIVADGAVEAINAEYGTNIPSLGD